MGSGEWTYDSSKQMLQTVTLNPTIQLRLQDHETLDSALVLPDKTIYRRIRLKKISN